MANRHIDHTLAYNSDKVKVERLAKFEDHANRIATDHFAMELELITEEWVKCKRSRRKFKHIVDLKAEARQDAAAR
jgi:hypothetical protein